MGVNASSLAATFSNGVYIPEYAYICFQMTFACITPALIVGGFAERVKFTPLILFIVLWLTIVYFRSRTWLLGCLTSAQSARATGSALWLGRARFRRRHGRSHQCRIAGLMGALVIGKRHGYKSEPMPPHR